MPIIKDAVDVTKDTIMTTLKGLDIRNLMKLLELFQKKLREMIENAGVGATTFSQKLDEIDEALDKLAENEVLSAEAIEKMCEIVTSVNEQMHCFTQENVKQYQEEFAKQLNAINLIREDLKPSQSLQEEVMKQFAKEGISLTQEQYEKAELYHEKGTSSFYLLIEEQAIKIDCSFKKDENDSSLSIPIYDVKLRPDTKSEALTARFIKNNSEKEERAFHEPQKEGISRFEKIGLVEKEGQDKFSYTMTLLNAKEKEIPVLTTEKELERVKAEAEKSVIDNITDPKIKYLFSKKDGTDNGKYEVRFFDKENTFAMRNKETGTLVTGHVTENGSKIEFRSREGIAKSLKNMDNIADLEQGSKGEVNTFCTLTYSKEDGTKYVSNTSNTSLDAVLMFHSSDMHKFLSANGLTDYAIDKLINDETKIFDKTVPLDEKYRFRVDKMADNIRKEIAQRNSYHDLDVKVSSTRKNYTFLSIKSPKSNEAFIVSFDEKGTAQNFYYKNYKDPKEKANPIYSVGKNQTTLSFDEMKKGKMFNDLFMLAFDNCETKIAQKNMADDVRRVQSEEAREAERTIADTNSEKFINVYFNNPEYAKATAEIRNEINAFMKKANTLHSKIQKAENNLANLKEQGIKAKDIINDENSSAEVKEKAKADRETLVQKYVSTEKKIEDLKAEYDTLVKSSPYGIQHYQTYSKMSTMEQEITKPYFDELQRVYKKFTDIDLSTATEESRNSLEKEKAEALIAYSNFVKEYPNPEKYLANHSAPEQESYGNYENFNYENAPSFDDMPIPKLSSEELEAIKEKEARIDYPDLEAENNFSEQEM